MFIAKTIKELQDFLTKEKAAGKNIALIPTMGALHQGHVSLFEKAADFAEVKVASIFVNKAQFNDAKDYEKYPRQVEADLSILKEAGINCVFVPADEEIFPSDFGFKILPTALTDCLCGATRPGHFDGVALIITKLFNIVKPDFALFGEKDFQQLMIIKKLVRDLNFSTQIIGCDIVREKSGLAMSSRNQRLSDAAKIKAAQIFKILSEIKKDPSLLKIKGEELLKNGFEKIDYLEIRDEKNLNLITNFDGKTKARIFIAVYLENLRLIDNVPLI
jgi:pantoate--beta-alanine ligase